MNFDDLITYENESTMLDFKAVQYDKTKYESFIKDVMSMANANIEGERYIIVGINHKSNGERDVVPIEKDDFIDAANYQQLIRDNIEPDIDLDYIPYEYKGKLVGIFRIYNCNDQPYMMRKQYKKFKIGDCFIRKDTHQTPMQRQDLDEIFDKKITQSNFDGIIRIGFIDTNYQKEIELKGIEKIELPSQKAAETIISILKKKKSAIGFSDVHLSMFGSLHNLSNPFSPIPYENRTIEQLEENLKNVKKDYRKDDFYKWFTSSYELNIEIINEGKTYIEDASLELEIPQLKGIYVFREYYDEPKSNFLISPIPQSLSFEEINYPHVEEDESKIIIKENIGHIKHHIPSYGFKVPFRIYIDTSLAGESINLKCRLFAKNLVKPIDESLIINIK